MRRVTRIFISSAVLLLSIIFITTGISSLSLSLNLEGNHVGRVDAISEAFTNEYIKKNATTEESVRKFKLNTSSVDITLEAYTNVNIKKNVTTGESVRKYEMSSQQHDEIALPKWIEDYMSWHARMRLEFPGKAIITDPNAPSVLVRACLSAAYGGLHDRLGQLPLDLYLANQTKRVLLIKWILPFPLENFLVPPDDGLDWTFPEDVPNLTAGCDPSKTPKKCAKTFRQTVSKIEGNVVTRSNLTYGDMIESSIKELNYGKLNDTKVVHYAILGHLNEEFLEQNLNALGEKDMIHHTPTFGAIFKRFFQPHPNVQKEIDRVIDDLDLIPGEYSIAHSRVCHPKAYTYGERLNEKALSYSDRTGLPFEGRPKDLAVNIATRAIRCAASLPDVSRFPIYFISDSNDLVRYMTIDLIDKAYLLKHSDWFTDPRSANSTAKDLISKYRVVAGSLALKWPYTHLDLTRKKPVERFYSTFVDLYLTINARCVSYGIGNYASFGAKLSGTHCKVKYAKEKWGPNPELHEDTDHCGHLK